MTCWILYSFTGRFEFILTYDLVEDRHIGDVTTNNILPFLSHKNRFFFVIGLYSKTSKCKKNISDTHDCTIFSSCHIFTSSVILNRHIQRHPVGCECNTWTCMLAYSPCCITFTVHPNYLYLKHFIHKWRKIECWNNYKYSEVKYTWVIPESCKMSHSHIV